jgi:hypothetical protein
MTSRKRLQLQLGVATEEQAAELRAAWEEVVSGKRVRLETAAIELDEIMERARTALQRIVKAIEDHPGSGQTRRLVRFLAAIYNGYAFHFDLTDLRSLDAELANACIDYLNYDRLSEAEVHTHLPGLGRQMQQFIAEHGIRPRPQFSDSNAHEPRLHAAAARLNRNSDALLNEALESLLFQYESKVFGNLLSTQPPPDGGRPPVHARLLSESVEKPLCRAADGPWSARGLGFTSVTCQECQHLVLPPEDAPA